MNTDTHAVNPNPKLILLCGLPGAGKTTLAKQMAPAIPAVRLCPEDWLTALDIDLFDDSIRDKLEIQFWEHAKVLLGLGLSVILESGFWLRSDRDEKRLGARALDIPVELYYLDVPLEERMLRINRQRESEEPTAAVVERHEMEHWGTRFQAPDAEELELFDNHTTVTTKPLDF
jgi:predicted kinase